MLFRKFNQVVGVLDLGSKKSADLGIAILS
jgi:hypothetical protein